MEVLYWQVLRAISRKLIMKKMKKGNIGLDMVDVRRFVGMNTKSKVHLLKKLFTASEIAYCSSFKDLASHLAGIFAAKEAVSKALGVNDFPFIEIEIRHDKEGAPEAWHKNKKLSVKVSITHTKTLAAAIALS